MIKREREREKKTKKTNVYSCYNTLRGEKKRAPAVYTLLLLFEKALLLLYFYFYHPSLNWDLVKNGFIITLKRIEHLFARV